MITSFVRAARRADIEAIAFDVAEVRYVKAIGAR
jgi:hypothetical protein